MIIDLEFLKLSIPYSCISFEGKDWKSVHEISDLGFKKREFYISIDTRSMNSGDAFIAFKGERVDAHDFLVDALECGSEFLIINDSERYRLNFLRNDLLENRLFLTVPDTYKALIDLAKNWRKKFDYHVVGVTGSIGKTTTKEIVSSILKQAKLDAMISKKNQNTLIGICLNILKMRSQHKVAVFEIGISEKGEMDHKVDLLNPSMGVITSIAHSHIEGLGNLDGIAREKKKIFKHFNDRNVGIIHGNQKLLSKTSYSHPVAKFGFGTKNNIIASNLKEIFDDSKNYYTKFTLKIYGEKFDAIIKSNHKGNIHNAMAAATISYFLNVETKFIIDGIKDFDGFEKRFEKRKIKNNKGFLISDCYNANPESMKEAILTVHKMNFDGSKIAIIGDMLELGAREKFWHRQIGRTFFKATSFEKLILVGKMAREIAKFAPTNFDVEFASDWKEAIKEFEKKIDAKNNLVLVKSSQGINLDKLVEEVAE